MVGKSQKKARGRGPGRPIRPGQRLPGAGRPKGSKSITSKVREAFTSGKAPGELVKELKRLTKDDDARVRLAAIREVIDRCDGKALESVNLNGEVSLRMEELAQSMAGRRAVQWMRTKHPGELGTFLKAIGVSA